MPQISSGLTGQRLALEARRVLNFFCFLTSIFWGVRYSTASFRGLFLNGCLFSSCVLFPFLFSIFHWEIFWKCGTKKQLSTFATEETYQSMILIDPLRSPIAPSFHGSYKKTGRCFFRTKKYHAPSRLSSKTFTDSNVDRETEKKNATN